MKINNGFILREVADSYVVVAVGDKLREFNSIINLNETGAFLWRILEKETTEQELIEKLLEEYDVDRETAEKDIKDFIQKIQEAGLLK